MSDTPSTIDRKTQNTNWFRSLSARLLVLTVSFVMLSEFLIFAPSVANFRLNWLHEKLNAAHLAVLTLDAAPDGMVSKEMESTLLTHVGVNSIAVKRVGMRQAMLNDMPPNVDESFDLRDPMFFPLILDAFQTFASENGKVIRVIGFSPHDNKTEIEIILSQHPLVEDIRAFGWRIVALSLFISIITAGLVYLSLQWFLVRPMRKLTSNMVRFAENPEDESRIMIPGSRRDEVGKAQQELSGLQRNLHNLLKQKEHLAALGTAVAKINHDLRGILSTALVVSDRLETSDDPKEVRKIAPTLISAIDRAVNLCSQTLNFVGQETPPINVTKFCLAPVIQEISEGIKGDIRILSEIKQNRELEADRDHIFRVITNLIQNSVQAGAETIRITLEGEDQDFWLLDLEDDGPGLPPRAEKNLFKPFQSSARSGGTGLGLVTARELIRAHGGDLWLLETGETGTVFRIHLPHHIHG
ncbi:sensor histidine kinase [Curvivirga sp.]|uniref:sensor histidine kinase n=1 Tax=Curvivirga sp. TaxID=2856848 RepID=UPI003B5AE9BF